MKIYSDSFKMWSKILDTYQDKGSPIGESIYFNFKDSYAYFGSKEGIGRMKFVFEKELEEEDITNFFIPTTKFLNVVTQYDYLNLSSKLVFTNGKDKYKLSTIVDDEKIDCSSFNFTVEKKLVLTKDHLDKINKTLLFTSKDEPNINYRHIFIQDKTICGLTTKTPMYESKIDFDTDACISLNVAKTISQVGFISDGCSLQTNSGNNKMIVSREGELEIIVPGSSSVDFPQNRDPRFIEGYKYETKLKVNTASLSKVLSVLRPYFNDVLNAKIVFSINEDISVKVEDATNQVERHIPYIEVSEDLKGKTYSISGTKIEQALGVLKGEELYICLPTSSTSPIVELYNSDDQHVLIARFKD